MKHNNDSYSNSHEKNDNEDDNDDNSDNDSDQAMNAQITLPKYMEGF